MKKLTNQGYAFAWSVFAFLIYITPLGVLAIIQKDKLFVSTGTTLTFFSCVIIVFCVIFAKRLVKMLSRALTPIGFASLVGLVLSIGIRALVDDLTLIFLASTLGAFAAWFPFQIAATYNKYAYDADGNVNKDPGMSTKECLDKMFQVSIISEEEESNNG